MTTPTKREYPAPTAPDLPGYASPYDAWSAGAMQRNIQRVADPLLDEIASLEKMASVAEMQSLQESYGQLLAENVKLRTIIANSELHLANCQRERDALKAEIEQLNEALTTNRRLRELGNAAYRTEIERLKADGPVMRRGSLGDGSDWMGTMRECLEDAREAARVEAALGDEARAKAKELRAEIGRLNGKNSDIHEMARRLITERDEAIATIERQQELLNNCALAMAAAHDAGLDGVRTDWTQMIAAITALRSELPKEKKE